MSEDNISAESFRRVLEVRNTEDQQGNRVRESIPYFSDVFEYETMTEILKGEHAYHSLDALIRALDEKRNTNVKH